MRREEERCINTPLVVSLDFTKKYNMNPHYLSLIALFSFFLFLSPSSAHNKTHQPPPAHNNKGQQASSLNNSYKGVFSAVYAFGGSYTDTGNAQSLAGTSSDKPINRTCDGRLLIDFLCELLSIPPLPPYNSTSSNFSFGVNFAIAGSTDFIGHRISHPLAWKEAPVNLQTQVEWFGKFRQAVEFKGKSASSSKAEFENALFWIGPMGINDYTRIIGSSFSLNKLTEMFVNHNCKLVQTFLDSGAKYIVVQGLPPVGCLPAGLSSCPLHGRDKTGCAANVNAAIMIHNKILEKELANIQTKHPNCTILYADYWNAYMTILMNPTKYHFQEPFKACCGAGGGELNYNMSSLCGSKGTSTCDDPGKYINWDGIHLTEAMHRQVINLFLNQGFCRPSFDKLIKNKSGM